jgi:hypothetical protein
LAIDDLPPSDLGNAIAKAGNRIDLFLSRRYDTAQLMESDLVKDWAAALACSYLRRRRGNPQPQGIAELAKEALADLTEIKHGLNDIPGIGMRKSFAPGQSKMRATLRPYPRAVVEVSQSTTLGGVATGYQKNQDIWDRYGFNAEAFMNWWF